MAQLGYGMHGTCRGRQLKGARKCTQQELYEEILDFRTLLTTRTEKISSPEKLLNFIVQYRDENVFPNIRITLQILLTIAVSIIASCERSFSKLKLILHI